MTEDQKDGYVLLGRSLKKPLGADYSPLIKIIVMVLVSGYYALGYLGINQLNIHLHHYHDLSLWFEKYIPFVPYFILGYIFVYILIATMFITIDNMPDFWRTCKAFLVISITGFGIFLAFPVKMTLRPEIIPLKNWAGELAGFFYWLDKPYNLFPSMHVAVSFFSAFVCMRHGRLLGWVTLSMAFVVGISVILVKQHYTIDVLAGGLLALFGFRIFFRR